MCVNTKKKSSSGSVLFSRNLVQRKIDPSCFSQSLQIKKKSLDTQLKSKVEMYCTVMIRNLIQMHTKSSELLCDRVMGVFLLLQPSEFINNHVLT